MSVDRNDPFSFVREDRSAVEESALAARSATSPATLEGPADNAAPEESAAVVPHEIVPSASSIEASAAVRTGRKNGAKAEVVVPESPVDRSRGGRPRLGREIRVVGYVGPELDEWITSLEHTRRSDGSFFGSQSELVNWMLLYVREEVDSGRLKP